MLESAYNKRLVKKLEQLYPGCLIIRLDPNLLQGIPDLLILWRTRWAMLEVKASARAQQQPNQRYYVEHFDEMSFAAFIYPENEREVLRALQQAFTS